MDSEKRKLVIGYSGTLAGFDPGSKKSSVFRMISDWIWTFQVRNIDAATRSGYFLFKGIQKLKEKYPEQSDFLDVKFWGMIEPLNRKQAEQFGISDIVSIRGYLPKNESLSELLACDVLFLPMESMKDGNRTLFIPGKLFEYLKTGKPVLALAGSSDGTDILQKSGLAVICDPFNEEMIAQKLLFLIENRNRLNDLFKPETNYIESNFNFKNLAKKLASVFDELLAQE